MIRPQPQQQAGLLLRSLGAGGGGHARPGAMKSATSLLLGAALATAFFLLYTSLCRDLGAAAPRSASPPQRWEQETNTTAAEEVPARLVEPKRPEAGKEEEGRKHVAVSSGDGDDGRGGGGAASEEKSQSKTKQQRIVMPDTSTQQVSFVFLTTLSLAFDLFNEKRRAGGENSPSLLRVFTNQKKNL